MKKHLFAPRQFNQIVDHRFRTALISAQRVSVTERTQHLAFLHSSRTSDELLLRQLCFGDATPIEVLTSKFPKPARRRLVLSNH